MVQGRQRSASVTIFALLLAAGCASGPPAAFLAEHDVRARQTEAALQEATAEAAALRADVAAARIAAAKQEAELRDLRRQVNELQHMVEAKHAELTTLRDERDRLTQAATIAQVRVADPPTQSAGAVDVVGMQARLRELESALAALTTEVAQMKKDMGRTESTPQR